MLRRRFGWRRNKAAIDINFNAHPLGVGRKHGERAKPRQHFRQSRLVADALPQPRQTWLQAKRHLMQEQLVICEADVDVSRLRGGKLIERLFQRWRKAERTHKQVHCAEG
jgi:hypothetical protein